MELQRIHSVDSCVLPSRSKTAQSVNLAEYRFPSKSVIILGKEREGIPVEILDVGAQCFALRELEGTSCGGGLRQGWARHAGGALDTVARAIEVHW